MKSRYANGLLLLASCSWGIGNVAQKSILEHLGVFTATGIATLVAAVLIFPFFKVEIITAVKCRQIAWPQVLLIAAFFILATTTMQLSFAGTSVTNASFIVNTCAVMTPMVCKFLFRERLAKNILPAGILGLAGIWMIGGCTFTHNAWGDWVGLLAAALYSIWMPLMGRYVVRHGHPGFLTFVQFVCCGLACTAIGFVVEITPMGSFIAALPEIIILGVFAKCIAYLLLAIAQQHTSASTTAIICSAESIFSTIFAQLVLNERMSLTSIAGTTLIAAGIIIVQLPKRLNSRQPKSINISSISKELDAR
jgi:drug/metabolite transporter (DMT)-like permease